MGKTMESMTANVICIKWGTKYSADDVNTLYRMARHNCGAYDLQFFCFTDDSTNFDENIIVRPLPVLNVAPEDNRFYYKKEAALCDDALGGLTGERVFFLDLDVVITGSLEALFDYPKADEFITINDWNTKGNHVGQASCYSWVVGTLGYVKADFEAEPKRWIEKFGTASQEYLSYKVIEKTGKLNFWPAEWVQSFKFNCLPVWYKRAFIMPTMKGDARILVFHGDPKATDAIKGIWCDKVPLIKRLYKTIRPSPWIAKYLDV